MARIRNLTLPSEFTEVLVSAAEVVPEPILLLWGREVLAGGFTRAATIRERLIARVRSDATLDPKVLDVLATGFPLAETVAALTLPALQSVCGPLLLLLGQAEVILTLLLDPREEVQVWAAELALKPAPPLSGPPENIVSEAERLGESLLLSFIEQKLLAPAGISAFPLSQEAPPGPPNLELLEKLNTEFLKELSQKNEAQRKTIERLQEELQQLKHRQATKLREQSDAIERERKEQRTAIANAHAKAAALAAEKQALEKRLQQATQNLDETVARQVREQTSAVVRKWLAQPQATEELMQSAEPKARELLERVGHALEAQARYDRHAGNRLELANRLEHLRAAKLRARDALQNALHPIAELRPLLGELDAEIARLERVLTGAKPVSELGEKLLTALSLAKAWEDVRQYSSLADQLTESGLLASEEARAVYEAVQRKFSLLDETTRAKAPEGDTGWTLRDFLYRNKNALLLLDGHNLLYGLKDIFAADYENGHPQRKARQKLIDIVSRLVRNRSNVSTKICFDGPKADCIRLAPNLEVHYSGGSGEHRADELIVSHLQFKDLRTLEQKVFVVSDDREVRRGILRAGASFVPCDLFAVFLQDFKCL